MVILSLLPIIILVAIIVAIIFLNKRLQKSPLTYSKSKWIVIGYILILAATAVLSTLLPNTEAKVIEDLEQDWSNSLYQRAHNGEFSSFDEEEITDNWEFPYTNDKLTIFGNQFEESILVDKTSQLNGKIEVYYIEDWQVMDINSVTLDISEYIPAVQVELDGDKLVFEGFTENQKILLAYAEPEFTMKQFIGDYERGYSYSGSRFFYIRVPENIKVEYVSNLIIDFVEN